MITLTGNPLSVNNLYRYVGHRVYMTAAGASLKESYQWEAKAQWRKPPLIDLLYLDIQIYFSDLKVRDADNFQKIVFDALKGIVFKDDSLIQSFRVTKNLDRKKPRVEVTIIPWAQQVLLLDAEKTLRAPACL